MNAELYEDILRSTLLPFLSEKFPQGHRFMQDNDPKHTSGRVQAFLTENGVNWWKTAAESPDLNPIENLWHELKEYIRREVKPHTKEELIEGILKFWRTVDKAKCTRYVLEYFCMHAYTVIFSACRYIRHLAKVIPKVIEVQGEPTGY